MCGAWTWLAVGVNLLTGLWHLQAYWDYVHLKRQYQHYVETLEAVVQQYDDHER